ncbi:Vps54-domain-containing protein [Pleurostoma richardsiae]|uniref:Vacuolar protein sorting-associated protein 54 n=1 Tax=Pleurostoma richardsiae TaxID=41990 RepID=A0AA38RHN9_9PEZI|nr:Vps54-domain-containing protein [Pleurostoma richardsiae]
MFSNSAARMSVDSLSPTSPYAHRGDFPFHRQGSAPPYTGQRRGSTASSIHSIGGVLDTSPGSWGDPVLEIGQNAISTLLQPPIVRTGLVPHTSAPASSAHKPPTARDIPPVALTNIPHVDPAEFKPYLSQVGALYEQLRRIKESDEDAAEVLHRRGSKPDELAEGSDDRLRPGKRPSPSRKSSVSSLSSVSPLEAPSPIRRSSSNFARRATQGPPPLSTIPNVYFEEDFHLENPRTFDVVSERSEVVRPPPGTVDDKKGTNGTASAPRKALATNAILQEKLSWYMDTIEMHLISSISTASTTFFTALGSLKDLHSEAAESVDRIRALRKELEALDEEIATTGLNIVQNRRRRENLQQLHDAVQQLRAIVDGVSKCETLVEAGEAEKALDGIDSLEKLIAGEQVLPATTDAGNHRPLRDLRSTAALQDVNGDIATLRFRIGRDYESKFMAILMADLRRHVETVKPQEVLMRWTSASVRARGGHAREPSTFPSYMASTEGLRKELLGSLTGLHRAKHITVATTAYREAALREIRNLVRRPLPSSNDDDNESMMSSSTMTGGKQRSQQEKSSILARNLRALEPEDAEDLLVKIYISVAETMRRLSTQVKLLLDVASTLGHDTDPSGLRSPLSSPTGRRPSIASLEAQEEIHKAIDMPGLLGQAVDVAQDKIVKVLRVRSEQSTHLPLVWFLRYFTLNLHFANECESISGRSGTSLKNVINGHIKDFVQKHSDGEKQKLAQGMDSDQWNAKDFTEKDAALLNQILDCSTKDPAEWVEGTKIWIPYSATDPEASGHDEISHPNGGGAKSKTRSAVIDSETFLLPNSAVLCMEGTSHFLHLIVGIPSITSDVATSLISFLQVFNSRCTQLILGAGATRSAGLKNITTKHLALASQALAFIAALIPHVREFARRHAGSGPAVSALMGEFDKVRRLYQEHQNSIYDKLVEIMSSRASAHARAMKSIDWDGEEKKDGVHGYMETLAKETTTLHRNLTKHLPEGTVRVIMVPVFSSYRDQLSKVFQGLEPKTELGRDSMLRDVGFFEAKLGKIDGFGDTGEYLTTIIESKQVKSATPPPPPAPAAPAVEPESNGDSRETAEESSEAGTEKNQDHSVAPEGPAQAETKEGEGGPTEKEADTKEDKK